MGKKIKKIKKKQITDSNITGKNSSAHAADLGIAHELIVAGILIRLGFEAAIMQLTRSPFDLLMLAFEKPGGKKISLKVQVKTTGDKGSIAFSAGSRGGVDRVYKSGKKTYKYTTKHNDLIIGFNQDTFDLYLLPTRYIKKWGTSKAISKLEPLKNNWDILLNWNDVFLSKLELQLKL